ncbi:MULTISPECIES: hypothetical protein [Paenibacillus]|uniref:Uncharacterized protein n=1 Tax=Paenibacillus naphthalenovorans TaxID=162209 RepID=A0A0U2VJJ4_9BACL|nr:MULTISPECIES: hypothetical protein [Paenibacillus]ALS20966.1 hypothetical protein IJ22_05790 [Paenibacillus naphthalenovorans]NTZ18806.1 hypothetical protein [Paenibacillus sp. JMULE4]GCL70997.1 hypothetical protein PN4B1_09010 [Paenibacillus naphthalenovorans]SDI60023.1 hypothetical protein SAMN05421868_10872 [Paenibacillus naphthalenovorans]
MQGQDRSIMSRKGFYTKVGNDFVGVFLSNEGPKMFINREVYELMAPCWDVEMVKGRSHQIVNFYWRGEVKLSVRCEADNDIFMPLFDYLSCRESLVRHA